jgi:hypothetical protein
MATRPRLQLRKPHLDDLSDVLERRAELLLLVVAERDVVGQVPLIAQRVHGLHVLVARVVVVLLWLRTNKRHTVGLYPPCHACVIRSCVAVCACVSVMM